MDETVVALLGTGTMGAGMARRIAAAGLPLRVWNRTAARAATLADVATVAPTPGAAVAGADLVVTMLYDADSVAEVVQECRGDLADGAIWVQTSTVGVAGNQRLTALAADLGMDYVDAPVLGTRAPAADGTLVVLAAGPVVLRARVAPLFEAIGSRTLWAGETPGAASALKLVANGYVLTVLDGISHALSLAGALGLEPALFLEAMRGGPVDSPYVGVKGRAMLAGDYDPSFALAGALKDADLILAAASDTGLDAPELTAVRDHLARGVAAGHGDLDMAAVHLTS